METRMTVVEGKEVVGIPVLTFTKDQVQLIKNTVAKGTTDDELSLFLYTAKATGLNPLLRQIHAVKRWDSKLEKEVMAIQTGIDGYRLIAERTKKYSPGKEPTFAYKEDGKSLLSATAYILKLVDGTWHEVSATAYFDEFVQTKKDGTPNHMWAKMPHSQLAKCSEALALRKAFPAEFGGVHTDEEMGQAENPVDATPRTAIAGPEAKKEAVAVKKGALKENEDIFVPTEVKVLKKGETKNGPWTLYGVVKDAHTTYITFSEDFAAQANQSVKNKKPVSLIFKSEERNGKTSLVIESLGEALELS